MTRSYDVTTWDEVEHDVRVLIRYGFQPDVYGLLVDDPFNGWQPMYRVEIELEGEQPNGRIATTEGEA